MGQKIVDMFMNLIFRGCIGIGIIYFLNMYLMEQNIMTAVGINGVTALVTSSLGIPGVGLLYGISFFQML